MYPLRKDCSSGQNFGCHHTIKENSIETCILPYGNWIASPGSMHETGHSGLVHWDDPEGWDGEGSGWGVHDGDTCTHVVDSCQHMAKTTTIL